MYMFISGTLTSWTVPVKCFYLFGW